MLGSGGTGVLNDFIMSMTNRSWFVNVEKDLEIQHQDCQTMPNVSIIQG